MSVLSFEECAERVLRPVHQAEITEGMRSENDHKRHIQGDKRLLESYFVRNPEIEPEKLFDVKKRKAAKNAITKTVYAPIKAFFAKAWNSGGNTYQFHFEKDDNGELAQDFKEYLSERDWDGKNFFDSIHKKIHDVHFVGFQGIFLVDLPNKLSTNPEPYHLYWPSAKIHDIDIEGDKVEFVILKEEVKTEDDKYTRYYCIDDVETKVLKIGNDGNPIFDTFVDEEGTLNNFLTPHNLGYVPAFLVSYERDNTDTDITRSSLVGPSIILADRMIDDDANHELNKNLHAFMEKWVYAEDCPTCDAQGKIIDEEGHEHTCHQCNGQKSVYPVGPDLVFHRKMPFDKDTYTPEAPAGYIQKDLEPTQYLKDEIDRWGKAINISVFSQELEANISPETATAKEIDDDSKKDKVREYVETIQNIVKNIIDTFGKMRYGENYIGSTVYYNKNLQTKKATELEQEYKDKKIAGMNKAVLFDCLKDIIEAKYKNDPVRKKRELIKLHLLPNPTMTDTEVIANPYISEEDKKMHVNFNDYINRFEREIGPLENFGSFLLFQEQITRIRDVLLGYNNENVLPLTEEENVEENQAA